MTIRKPNVPDKKKPSLRVVRPETGDPEVDEAVKPEEFAKEMFGQADIPQMDKGLPTLEWLKSQFNTKSACIRYLTSLGFEVKVIAKHLGIKYQHARNVSLGKLKRGPNEDWHPKAERATNDWNPPQQEPEED